MNAEHIETLLIKRPDRLQLCAFADLVSRPPAPWQIRGVLREQSVSLLYGRRGCYKSFLALDLAASLATGEPWHTHAVLTPGFVVYVAGEGGGGMVQRARAWSEEHQCNPRHIRMAFITEPLMMTADSDDVEILIHRIRDAINWQPQGYDPEVNTEYDQPVAREWPVLIVIDTLARCFFGNENAPEDMGQFIQGVDRVKQEFNTSVLILHHTGRDESHERGHTSLASACDTIYRVDHDADTQSLTLTNEKMKDSREPVPLELSYREVRVSRYAHDDSDENLTSVIIESAAQSVQHKTEGLLELLDAGSLTWAEWLHGSTLPKTTFNRLIVGLVKNKEIVKENGSYRKC